MGKWWAVEVETERLRMRPLTMGDAAALSPLQRDPEMMRYFGDGHPYDSDEARVWLEWHVAMWELEGYSFWALELKPDLVCIGWLGLNKVLDAPDLMPATEAGWFVDRAHWGRGLATEGARRALAFGFDQLGLDRIIARYNADNVASGRVMEKIGMHFSRQVPHLEMPGAAVNVYEVLAPAGEGQPATTP